MKLDVALWDKSGILKVIDQTLLPVEKQYIDLKSREEFYSAIKRLVVRGAPLIGIAGAYGLAADLMHDNSDKEGFLKRAKETAKYLNSSRPTAVNLSWALDRMLSKLESLKDNDLEFIKVSLIEEAGKIHSEDALMCSQIGQSSAPFIKKGMNILTHCNAGSLATGGSGTALAVIYQAAKDGKNIHVYADETRPLLQGARLTAYELTENGIDTTLICDSMAGFLMKQGKIDIIVTGADRIALNGDTANKIGTCSLALLAGHFNIPFYIAAPSSTFDRNCATGAMIPIEEREAKEIIEGFGKRTAPADIKVYNPAFDVTDNDFISGFFTEKGFIAPPFKENFAKVLFNED